MPTFVDLNDLETLSLFIIEKNAFLQENGLNSKLKQIKAQNSILSGRSGDMYRRLGDWYHIRESWRLRQCGHCKCPQNGAPWTRVTTSLSTLGRWRINLPNHVHIRTVSYRLHCAAKQLVAKRFCGETTILQLYPCVCVYVEGGNRRVHTSHLPYHAFLASALINHFQLMSLFYSHFPPSFISQLLLFSLPYPIPPGSKPPVLHHKYVSTYTSPS